MPFNELQRRDSWPPTILRINDEDADGLSPIDRDPFSYFLTSPDELDDDEDLSAGIESATKPTPVREISPSSLQRSPRLDPVEDEDVDDIDEEFFLATPFSITDTPGDGRESRTAHRADALTGLGISLPQHLVSVRGRPAVRLAPPSRGGRGRGQTRSLSARRPHSWRVPSPDLGSIMEEKECEEDTKIDSEKKKSKRDELSMNAPMPSEMEKAKPKKRVHWAF
jgi:hypothetical protein